MKTSKTSKNPRTRVEPAPTAEQLAALTAFAVKHGRTWKSTLLAKWANGSDANEPNGGLLRQVRNAFGPSWLERFKLPESAPTSKPHVFDAYPNGTHVEYHSPMAEGGRAWLPGLVTSRTATLLHVAVGERARQFSITEADVKRYVRPRPPCVASMGCLCAGHARGNAANQPCDTSEVAPMGTCEVCGRDDVPLQPDGMLARHDSLDAILDEFEHCAGSGSEPIKPEPDDSPAPVEITRYAVNPNGTRNRSFDIGTTRVLVSGEDDDAIARVAGDLAETARALSRMEEQLKLAGARCAELQAEIDRQCKLNAQLSADLPPKRPAQILAPGYVRVDPVTSKLWLLSGREKGWGAFGVIVHDWDDLFRRFNVRVTEHGIDETGAWWEVVSC